MAFSYVASCIYNGEQIVIIDLEPKEPILGPIPFLIYTTAFIKVTFCKESKSVFSYILGTPTSLFHKKEHILKTNFEHLMLIY